MKFHGILTKTELDVSKKMEFYEKPPFSMTGRLIEKTHKKGT